MAHLLYWTTLSPSSEKLSKVLLPFSIIVQILIKTKKNIQYSVNKETIKICWQYVNATGVLQSDLKHPDPLRADMQNLSVPLNSYFKNIKK